MMIEDALQSIQTEMNAEELSLSVEQVQMLFAPIQFEQQSSFSISEIRRGVKPSTRARLCVDVPYLFRSDSLFEHDCNGSRDGEIIACHGNSYFQRVTG